jgi:glycosyltransferase involved in cell wall biosynthesis
MERRKVSIIVPTYNSERTLERCLQSVKSQSYPFCEIVIVDGFSVDRTLEIAGLFQAKIVQQECNPALARNTGVASSTGRYILFVDSDQVLSPSVVEECVKKCANENVEMVKIPEVFIGGSFWSRCSAALKNSYGKVDILYADSDDIIHGEPRFYAKNQLVGGEVLDRALLWGENYDLYQRLRKRGVKEGLCRSEIYHHELASLREILLKNVRYGRSMPAFVRQTNKRIFLALLKQATLALNIVVKDFSSLPTIIVGCAFLLFLKAYSTALGLLIS